MQADAGASPASPDGQAWAALATAGTAEQLCRAWLQVLAGELLQAQASLLLLAQPDGAYAPVAAVPADRDLSALADIATEALRGRQGLLRRDDDGALRLAYPLQLGDELAGAVVVDLGAAPQAAGERALRLTHWGAGWLVDLWRQRQSRRQGDALRQGRFVLDTLLALQTERGERAAALALVHRVAVELEGRQVLLAAMRRRGLKIIAVSHSAVFDERAGAMNLARQAMHEACDQRRRIDWPVPDGQAASQVAVALGRYAQDCGSPVLASVPLPGPDGLVGALLIERDRPFRPEDHELLDTLALALAPLLQLQRDAAQGAAARTLRTARRALGWATDSSHPAIKLGLGLAVLVLALLAIVPVPFRIAAPAVVEGAVQRSMVAPFEGFLKEAPARAGDRVRAGQVLARLEDKDLRLERLRWESELEVALRKEREAMAQGQRVEQRLAAAQALQARAQLDLVLARLERAEVTAPFDGIVVKGDLSQQLGSPLQQGQVLFELAPLDAWRVILKVDERDVAHVRAGAVGELVLASQPGSRWPFTVRQLTPVSVAEEGRNSFRVEAELGAQAPRLTPNMEGVGKIDAGRASLLWAWTRPLLEWARLAWWRAMP